MCILQLFWFLFFFFFVMYVSVNVSNKQVLFVSLLQLAISF